MASRHHASGERACGSEAAFRSGKGGRDPRAGAPDRRPAYAFRSAVGAFSRAESTRVRSPRHGAIFAVFFQGLHRAFRVGHRRNRGRADNRRPSGCEHVVLPIEPNQQRMYWAVQRAFDEPSAANSAIPFGIFPNCAEHVKVVLCGEGGDELFMGYKRQRTAQATQQWRRPSGRSGGLKFSTIFPRSRRRN